GGAAVGRRAAEATGATGSRTGQERPRPGLVLAGDRSRTGRQPAGRAQEVREALMFERFTKDARATVTGAVEHAERTGAGTVTEDHLLLALLDRDAGRAAFAITALGLADR